MKKLKYIASLAGSLLISTSCVDLYQDPQSFISEEEYISNIDQESLEGAVSALYNNLWHDNYGFNSRIQRIQVCADEITYRAAKPGNELAYYDQLSPNIAANTKDFDTMWEAFYFTIANANKLICRAKAPAGSTEEKVKEFNSVMAEAYFLRGLSYFYLVRMFGNVPMIPEDGNETTINYPLSTPDEVYTKMIVPSLEYAVTWLPETPRSGNSSTPTKWAAETCLADVYITMAGWPLKKEEYYAKAAEAAKDVLDNNKYHEQLADYASLWKEANKNNSEFMFCLHHSHKDKVMASNYGKSYYPADFYNIKNNVARNGWADFYARKEAFENYPDDKRKEWNFMTEWHSTANNNQLVQWQNSPDKLPCISKYYNYDQGQPGQNAQSNGVTCIYRLADAQLLYAEASTRATKIVNAQAKDAVKSLQDRAGYAERSIIEVTGNETAEEFLKIVSNERSYEFYAEMRRWFELVRTEQVSVKRAEKWNGSFFQTQGHYYFPIPSQQILLTGWENNKGY